MGCRASDKEIDYRCNMYLNKELFAEMKKNAVLTAMPLLGLNCVLEEIRFVSTSGDVFNFTQFSAFLFCTLCYFTG